VIDPACLNPDKDVVWADHGIGDVPITHLVGRSIVVERSRFHRVIAAFGVAAARGGNRKEVAAARRFTRCCEVPALLITRGEYLAKGGVWAVSGKCSQTAMRVPREQAAGSSGRHASRLQWMAAVRLTAACRGSGMMALRQDTGPGSSV
jgi:hypothetical protein